MYTYAHRYLTAGMSCMDYSTHLCARIALGFGPAKHGLVGDGEEKELEHAHVGGAHHLRQHTLGGEALETVCHHACVCACIRVCVWGGSG